MDSIRFRLRFYLVIFFAVMVIGTLSLMAIEGLSLVDALYFSIVTIATVGYGDIHPLTKAGKFLAILMIVMGVGTFLGVIANVTEMMLNKREQGARLQKLNMLAGIFFGEFGARLIELFARYDPRYDSFRRDLVITNEWTDEDFARVSRHIRNHDYTVDFDNVNFAELSEFLSAKRDFLVRLLQNPTLMEHEAFTDLLHALCHLTEELIFRKDFKHLPPSDRKHLAGDIKRVYHLLINQWLAYMQHLKKHYPYLFSLAMRTNPFDKKASVIVQ